ncbi:DUF3613 domain-containing protein [Caballeronia sp. SEWSISQ10-4 2]|uniref:DUF3613 domain-containing protein n=1 Tax=Caballeronia sp. SEWSISQ10-4 2 TaxID=2937438 RepID=UPI00264B17EA|nr:DUF3613 domain-containing protein [Caballeronia sp. SEWSISQ10-4 2]MDN7178956.1 DUF3613 domain-containing protein [Caballeronia sp. SEWSISQ10-4 2]
MNEYRTMRGRGGVTGLAAGLIVALGSMAIAACTAAQTQTPLTAQAEPSALQAQEQPKAQPQTGVPLETVTVARHVTLIGDATLSLLALQRSGQMAAPAQPMLGAEASAAYARYLRSFNHPIPEHLDSSVGTVGGAAGGGGQN